MPRRGRRQLYLRSLQAYLDTVCEVGLVETVGNSKQSSSATYGSWNQQDGNVEEEKEKREKRSQGRVWLPFPVYVIDASHICIPQASRVFNGSNRKASGREMKL